MSGFSHLHEAFANAGFDELANGAIAFLEAVAAWRAQGLEARVRTQARCGAADTYAFSMIGKSIPRQQLLPELH